MVANIAVGVDNLLPCITVPKPLSTTALEVHETLQKPGWFQ